MALTLKSQIQQCLPLQMQFKRRNQDLKLQHVLGVDPQHADVVDAADSRGANTPPGNRVRNLDTEEEDFAIRVKNQDFKRLRK